jgi:hypothetical protein
MGFTSLIEGVTFSSQKEESSSVKRYGDSSYQ